MKDIFTHYYETNFWRDKDSVSGAGSSLKATAAIRKSLPQLVETLGITTLLDIPCGDLYWMARILPQLKLERYIGGDIVDALIAENRQNYVHPDLEFQVMNAVEDWLPIVDMILCRDMLGHLPNRDVMRVIKNFRTSGSTWLLATTFPHWDNANNDIQAGEWRPINLGDFKFGLGPPILTIDEKCVEGKGKFKDKSLGLWRLN